MLQAPPPEPQAEAWLPGWHTLFWQQPEGQLSALQTHCPPTQASPAPQAGPLPQRQAPFAHRSAVSVSQALQVPPCVPQLDVELTLHTLPAQQPFGQVVALQTHWPFTHA